MMAKKKKVEKKEKAASKHHDKATTVALISVMAAAVHGIGGQFVPAQPKPAAPPPQVVVVVNPGEENRKVYANFVKSVLPDGEPPKVLEDVYTAKLIFSDDDFNADLHLSWQQAGELTQRFAAAPSAGLHNYWSPGPNVPILVEYQPLGYKPVDVQFSKNDMLHFLSESWNMTPELRAKLNSLEKIVIAQKKTGLESKANPPIPTLDPK